MYRLETAAGELQIVLAAPAAGIWEAWLEDEFVGSYRSAADAATDLARRMAGRAARVPPTIAGWPQT
jgi:hypothetical protein